MKLCRLKKGKNTLSSVRRAKRFAFAIALAGFANSAVLAQTTLPTLPEPLTIVSPQFPKLVFCEEHAKQKVVPQLESRLVGILGLATVARKPIADETCDQPHVATVCEVESPGSTVPVNGSLCATTVVLASASEQPKSTDGGDSGPADEESLFDFEMQIPGIPQGSTTQAVLPSKVETRTNSTAILSEPPVRAMPGVAHKGRTMRLSIDPPAVAPPSLLTIESVDSDDPTEKRSLVIDTADDQENDAAEFRFSDAVDIPSENETSQIGVSSRKTPGNKPATVVSRAGRMRVRIEGEPSIVVPSQHLSTDGQNIQLADVPKPTFQVQDGSRPALAINKSARVAPQKSEASSTTKLPEMTSIKDFSTGESLVIARQDSSSIATDSRIMQYSTEHASVCKLIKTGDKTLSLIGLAQGESRIAIVTIDDSGKRRVEVRDVRVVEGSAAQVDLRELSREITQTVARLYPRSKIEIVSDGEQLIVQGTVRSERDARKIVSLVRKTALTPVIDRLQSYRQH